MNDMNMHKMLREDIHRKPGQYAYGRDMKDHQTNSMFNEWCRWYFPEEMKEKIKDDKLYLIWYHYNESSDPQNSSCSYDVYYIEEVPEDIQYKFEMHKQYEEELKKYQRKYEA